MKKIVIILLVVIIIVFIMLGIIVGNSIPSMNAEKANETSKKLSENSQEKIISGKGSIVSFNIEKLDTGFWSEIDEVYVKDGDLVKANQKILKVSNDEANGVIYSTIDGKFFIDEVNGRTDYYIYDLDNVGFEIQVDEKDSAKLKIGQLVNVKVNSISDKIVGNVYYISQISNDGKIKVKIKIDYMDKIKFGFTAKGNILTDEVDTEFKEFDTKNSLIKIGKTAITYKNNEQDVQDISEMNIDGMIEEFGEEYMEESFEENIDMPDEIEYNIEEISEYFNGYWNEYWSEYWYYYWKNYYGMDESVEEDLYTGEVTGIPD